MPKEEFSKKKKSLISGKLILIFVFGLILGAVIQLMFVQPLLDNSDSFKSKLAVCESSRSICDKEVSNYLSCIKSNSINPENCSNS